MTRVTLHLALMIGNTNVIVLKMNSAFGQQRSKYKSIRLCIKYNFYIHNLTSFKMFKKYKTL